MDEKNIIRKCAACSALKPRSELIKITLNKSCGEVRVMPESDFFGRSVYLCRNIDCVNAAFKKNKIFRILKIKIQETLEEKIRAVLEK